MFTQPGFNLRRVRTLGWARVSLTGKSGIVWAKLTIWPSGDIAWVSSTRVCWPERVHVHSILRPGPRSRWWGESWSVDLKRKGYNLERWNAQWEERRCL